MLYDSLVINAVLQSLEDQSVAAQYMNLLREANSENTKHMALLTSLARISIGNDIERDDIIFPKLFTALHRY